MVVRHWIGTAQVLALAVLVVPSSTQSDDNICATNPVIGRAVVESINSTWPGLEKFRDAVQADNLGWACAELAQYYSTNKAGAPLRWTPPHGWHENATKKVGGLADQIMDDIYDLTGVQTTAKIPRNQDGGINWYYTGPKKDPEFCNCLNRHAQWQILLEAWQASGNPTYASRFSSLAADWVTHLPCRGGVSMKSWNTSGDVDAPCHTGTWDDPSNPWRVLECGIRNVGPWPTVFYGFQDSNEFDVSSRVLMILGFSEHLAVINGPGRTAMTPNWAMTQWTGLAKVCVYFPELNNASWYLNNGIQELEKWLDQQVYPDGMETELAFGYDMATASDFRAAFEVVVNGTSAASSFGAKVEAMYNYGVMVTDQNGFGPRNGDADLGISLGTTKEALRLFNRPDWVYVRTNGENGTAPNTTSPSVMFPWGGQAVFKGGYGKEDSWGWFDVGLAYGSSGHAHRSKLAFNLRAYRSMLLVDSGRFSYNGLGFSHTLNKEYERTTHAHNTLIFDSTDQSSSPAVTTKPLPSDQWSFTKDIDVVKGTMNRYDALQGNVTHTRVIHYQRDLSSPSLPKDAPRLDYFIVIDQVATSQSRRVQAFWHIHPNSTMHISSTDARLEVTGVDILDTTKPSAATCDVIPATGMVTPWTDTNIIKGQNQTNTTQFQGWYSQTYDGAWPAQVAEYDASVDENGALFGWLIVSSPNSESRDPNAAIVIKDRNATRVTVQVTYKTKTDIVYVPI